jgi:hypothetical protein
VLKDDCQIFVVCCLQLWTLKSRDLSAVGAMHLCSGYSSVSSQGHLWPVPLPMSFYTMFAVKNLGVFHIFLHTLNIVSISFGSMCHAYQQKNEMKIKSWWDYIHVSHLWSNLAIGNKTLQIIYLLPDNDWIFRILLWVHFWCPRRYKNTHSKVTVFEKNQK